MDGLDLWDRLERKRMTVQQAVLICMDKGRYDFAAFVLERAYEERGKEATAGLLAVFSSRWHVHEALLDYMGR
jgi:hypothetical protein